MATRRRPTLDVYLSARAIGSLDRPGSGRIRFVYSDAAIKDYQGANLLSASLPVRREGYANSEAMPFFEGLLPEGVLRERVARELRVAYDDVHGLLERIGVECAGAVVLVPHGEEPQNPADAAFDWHSEDELADRIRTLGDRPLGITPGRVRLSLGGVQDKLVLVRSPAGQFGTPLYGAPSTHILKPGLGRYDGIAANEAFCLRVAACAGLSVARSEVMTIGGYECLVVERFDRTVGDGARIERLHQEDFCQALGVLPRDKYESDGGPSFARVVEATRRLSVAAAGDVVSLVRSLILNYLIGNSDAHAKNYALLYHPLTSARLAPLYDLVSTAVYDVEQRLAMSIGGEDDPNALGADDWDRLAADAGIGLRQLRAELGELSDRVRRCTHLARDQSHAEGWFHPVIDEIVAVAGERSSALAASAT